MSNINNILNSIYCLSQQTSSTVINLRLYPHIAKNIYSYRLYSLLGELRVSTLETFRNENANKLERNSKLEIGELIFKGNVIEETYKAFISTVDLPSSHTLIRKLDMQTNNILQMLGRIDQILKVEAI